MMLRRRFLSYLLSSATATGTTLSLTGCGTMLHSERLNQPHSGALDWKIVALNGLGLIFFFIPGVIAFVVDFHTGAIYLPAYPTAANPLPPPDAIAAEDAAEPAGVATASAGVATDAAPAVDATQPRVALRKIAVPTENLNLSTIQREVSHHLGRPVTLSETSTRLSELEKIEQFAAAEQRHQSDRGFGLSLKRFFQRRRADGQPTAE